MINVPRDSRRSELNIPRCRCNFTNNIRRGGTFSPQIVRHMMNDIFDTFRTYRIFRCISPCGKVDAVRPSQRIYVSLFLFNHNKLVQLEHLGKSVRCSMLLRCIKSLITTNAEPMLSVRRSYVMLLVNTYRQHIPQFANSPAT